MLRILPIIEELRRFEPLNGVKAHARPLQSRTPETVHTRITHAHGQVALTEHYSAQGGWYRKLTLRNHPLVDSITRSHVADGKRLSVEFKPGKGFDTEKVLAALRKDFAVLQYNPKKKDEFNYHDIIHERKIVGKLKSDPKTGKIVAVAFNMWGPPMRIFHITIGSK